MNENEKTIIILRSVPGSGKSTFAEFLKSLGGIWGPGAIVICCADDFFTDAEGNYNFDTTKLFLAHTKCQEKFKDAIDIMNRQARVIIVANTNTREKDVNQYKKFVEEEKNKEWTYQYRKPSVTYKVFVLTVENWHNGVDSHNVPKDTIENMKTQLRQSIKL